MMDGAQATPMNTDNSSEKVSGHPNLVTDELGNLFSNIQKKIYECVTSHHKPSKSDGRVTEVSTKSSKESFHVDLGIDSTWTSKDSSHGDLSLEMQLCAWRDNPVWVDHPPGIKVTIPKGCLSNLSLSVDVGLPPDSVFNIVIDPDNKRVFKNIKEVKSRKVLVDEGQRQVVEVEQAAIWRFLWWSGTISVHVLVDQNRKDYSMKFKQLKSGFMERFEGHWQIEPLFIDVNLCLPLKPKTVSEYVCYSKGRGRIGSRLRLEQLIQPAIVPPPPISWYLRGITTKTTEMLIGDLLAEAARIRQASSSSSSSGGGVSDDKLSGGGQAGNIKERWAVRRKNARVLQRRLSLNSKPF